MSDAFTERLRLIRFRRKREHSRFRDELRIIPKWLVVMCLLLYILALIIGFSVNHYGFQTGGDIFPGDESLRHDPALSYFELGGVITFGAVALSILFFSLGYVYRDAKRLGTTLQVPERMWPPDRVAFDEYWKRSLDELHIDPPVREHLRGVASVAFLPWPLRTLAGPLNLFATTGFLAPEFRAMMKLDWSQSQQRRYHLN